VDIKRQLQDWWRQQTLEDDTPFDNDSFSFVSSFAVHLIILIALGILPTLGKPKEDTLAFTSSPVMEELEPEVLTIPEEVYFSNDISEQVGANSQQGTQMAMSLAPVISEVSDIPNPVDVEPSEVGNIEVDTTIMTATGLHFSENAIVKGAVGVGTTGAVGAVDRLTHEILQSLEQRKTLVVWLFDQSPSMIRQRSTVNQRFEQIYKELGIIEAAKMEAFKKHEDKPLLTAVASFGKTVNLVTPKPTDDITEIQKAVSSIPSDDSGEELTFQAIMKAVNEYKHYRIPPGVDRGEPERNVLIVVFTDEIGSDIDSRGEFNADGAVKLCKRYQMPVYVVGVPAPFGTRQTQVKWVDPDPKFDQTPQWGVVEQGPESIMPERIRLSTTTSEDEEEALDSGFGPFALTRLCYETGGIYFTVHPNRDVYKTVSRSQVEPFSSHMKYFFDPQVMRRYKPDYVTLDEYGRRLKANKSREALVTAARMTYSGNMENPTLKFVKRSEAALSEALTEAQRTAAVLAPKLNELFRVLSEGEGDREKETTPRWQAGYDLAAGRIYAAKVRTEGYNAMLAAAKRGLNFKDPKNNTWVLIPSDEFSAGSAFQKVGDKAKVYLERVVKEHPDTPWALLAQKELKQPFGWTWKEEFTDLSPPMMNNNNNNPAPQPNDAKMMIKKPPVRPVPKKL
jgi:von Willebrand factor type A domain